MKTRTWALAVMVLASGGVAVGQDFKPFTSATGRYKVLFPGEVKSESNDITAGKEKLKLFLDSVELKADTVFMVSYIDASEAVAKQPAGPRLDKVRDGNK